jgi:hypothetical protein
MNNYSLIQVDHNYYHYFNTKMSRFGGRSSTIFKKDKRTVHIRSTQSTYKLMSHSQNFILKTVKFRTVTKSLPNTEVAQRFLNATYQISMWHPTGDQLCVKMNHRFHFKHLTFALWRCRVGPIAYPPPPPQSNSYIWGSSVWNESHYCFDMCKPPQGAHTAI